MTVESDAVAFEDSWADLTRENGKDVLDCGTKTTTSGKDIRALIPVGSRKADIEQLREQSKSDEPLAYEVVERTRRGSWDQEITTQKLQPNKGRIEMTDREKELDLKVNRDHDVPDEAEAGDVVALEDLVGDTRTRDEKDQDALDEADETGEEVVISRTTAGCNDPSKECNLDHVTRVATPSGEIETRRTHTY